MIGMQLIAMVLAWTVGFALTPALGGAQDLTVEETLSALGKGSMLGSPAAPVTVVEFSDFQCSFCKKFWTETLPKLKDTHIKKGQVRFIYRHFAILGKHSLQAGQGAECAGEQGRFWEYHDKLFSNQGGLAFTNAKLKQYAQEVDLKIRPFTQCLESDRFVKKIDGETSVAAFLGARGTPTFFVNRRLLVGAQPFKVFRTVIEEEQKKSRLKKKGG
jgi:protein-disulfide isomerase